MKSWIKNSFWILFAFLLVVACKKYEEGPSFTLRSACARLTGDYNVGSLTIDGADSTDLFNQLQHNTWFRFEKEQIGDLRVLWTPNDQSGFGSPGRWGFVSNKDSLAISPRMVWDFGPFKDRLENFKIIKLTNEQCILTKNYNSKVYVLILDKR